VTAFPEYGILLHRLAGTACQSRYHESQSPLTHSGAQLLARQVLANCLRSSLTPNALDPPDRKKVENALAASSRIGCSPIGKLVVDAAASFSPPALPLPNGAYRSPSLVLGTGIPSLTSWLKALHLAS